MPRYVAFNLGRHYLQNIYLFTGVQSEKCKFNSMILNLTDNLSIKILYNNVSFCFKMI